MPNDYTTLPFMFASTILLRAYARKTERRTRVGLVAAAFVALHVIQSLLFRAKPGQFDPTTLSLEYGNTRNGRGFPESAGANLVIFYNVFVHHGEKSGIALDVIKDQMGQVSNALSRLEMLGGRGRREERAVLYYNLIGNEAAFPPEKFRELCFGLHPRLNCVQLDHFENATEAVTLTSLYDYCGSDRVVKSSENHTRVVYLHSKGSYHDHGKQAPWRREMTNSTLHPLCLSPPDDSCDVCGAQYYTMFASMFPGNMWTAKCSYVRKLLPPVEGGEYVRRKERAIKQVLLLAAEGILKYKLSWHQDVFFGLDRYVWEHWVGSHPSIKPCEVHHPKVAFWDMVEGTHRGEADYDWGMGPRREMMFDKAFEGNRYKSKDVKGDFGQYYYLGGNVLKWIALYGEVPATDSWVWRSFPAGEMWKDHVRVHGTDSINALVESSRIEFQSPFANHSKSSTTSFKQILDEGAFKNSSLAVFYHISIPKDANYKEKALDAVKAQFDVISRGPYDNSIISWQHDKNITNTIDRNQKISIYYTIAGGDTQQIFHTTASDLCKKHSDKIICHELGVYADEVSGETLRRLHSFCKVMPSSKIVYVTNQLVGIDAKVSKDSFDSTKIKAATAAVMNAMCRTSNDSCNVCGTEFYPLPYMHFAGNAFSTTCDYVKDLLPPPAFEREMYEVAGDAYLAHLRKRYTSELLQFNPPILGMHQHSISHWIGSHPDLRPCDVAPANTFKGGAQPDPSKQYSWSLAPRRGSAPPGLLDGDREANFRSKREVAFREYYYLAGNLHRWHGLYDRMPADDSWVWRWFPDGELWRTAARAAGARAVDVIAKQLSSESGMEQFWVE